MRWSFISIIMLGKLILLFCIGQFSCRSATRVNVNVGHEQAIKFVPEPEPVATGDYLVGAFMCPLWNKENRPDCWEPVKKFPEREPVLGWYREGDPEVTDWEIKYALEHGISFFNVCWYRKKGNAGKPVEELFGHWTQSLTRSRYGHEFKFCILYVDEGSVMDGIASEEDFLNNLVPYWIDSFFKRPNYLKIDGKPLFVIYRPEKFIKDLGGESSALAALNKMRDACRRAGFPGTIIGGEYHGPLNKKQNIYRALGLDVAFSYHWPSFTEYMTTPAPPDTTNVRLQQLCWNGLKGVTDIPSVATVSIGWDSKPWGNTYYKGSWELLPEAYKALLQDAKRFIDTQPAGSIQSKLLMLDNWNEFGEGHYIFPTNADGFAYLDAVREVFATSSSPHKDIIPADVGLGPYEND